METNDNGWTIQHKLGLVLGVLQGESTVADAASHTGLQAAQIEAWVNAVCRSLAHTDAPHAPIESGAGEPHGDLRDLIRAPFSARDTVVVGPNELLLAAWQRMQQHDVSQLPVMDAERIVGILDESDVLLHVYGDEARFREPVADAMVSRLDKVNVSAPIEALLPVFDRGHVAIVMNGEHFLGLITRIDLLDYLRRRVV